VRNLFSELRRRNVFKVAAAYLVVGWILIQIAELLFPSFGAPDWVLRVFIILVALGFPLAMVLAWALELTPAGIQSQAEIDATPPASATERSSVAVLPFNNMSGDDSYEHLADGMSEDLTTFLSRIPNLYVVARNSTFAYKGQSPDIRTVGRDLDVAYVLEGSVRAMGSKVRVAAQLIEAETGTHLWAENYDADTTDVFAIQDEMLSGIVNAVGSRILMAEARRASGLNDEELDARGWVMRAFWVGRSPTTAAIEQMQHCARMALGVDPDYAPAYGLLAEALIHNSFTTFTEKAAGMRTEAFAMLRRAEELDAHNPLVMQSSGIAHINLGDKATGVAKLEIVSQHNPNSALVCAQLGYGLGLMGAYDRAEELFTRCFNLASNDANMWLFEFWRGVLYTYQPEKVDEAERYLRSALTRQHSFAFGHIVLAMVLAATERMEEGKQEIIVARELEPEAEFKAIAEVLRSSAAHQRMGEVFVEILAQVWPEQDRA
jgi:adenylate cyclase